MRVPPTLASPGCKQTPAGEKAWFDDLTSFKRINFISQTQGSKDGHSNTGILENSFIDGEEKNQ
jgi:hypothetical protein